MFVFKSLKRLYVLVSLPLTEVVKTKEDDSKLRNLNLDWIK